MVKAKIITTGILIFMLPSALYAQPVTFYDAVNIALNTLDEIVLAKATRDASQLATKQVIAGQRPTVSVSVDASNRFVGGFNSIEEQGNDSSATLSSQWNAYQFGRKKYARENARIDEKNADLTYYKTESTTIKTIVNTYFSLIEIRRQYEIQVQSEKSAESALVKDDINYKNGTLAESVYLNSQAKYAKIKATRIGLKVQLDNMEQEFARIIGFNAPDNLPIPDLSKIPLPASLQIAIEQALANNADLQTIRNTIDKLKNTLASQNAERKGTVSLSASSRKNIDDGGDLSNSVSVKYSVAFDLNKTNRYKVEKTASDLSNNTVRLKVEQNKVRNDLRQYWQSYITQKNMLNANKITVQANKVALETQKVMYETGQATSAELLEKIEAEINATKQYVTGLKQYAIAVVDILTVTGNMAVDKFSDL